MGTSVGSRVFIRYGWRACAALSLGWYGWQLFILLLRGPHCERYTWFGYEGGLEFRKSVVEQRRRKDAEAAAPAEKNEKKRDNAAGNQPPIQAKHTLEDGHGRVQNGHAPVVPSP
jgi:hypothetical protein